MSEINQLYAMVKGLDNARIGNIKAVVGYENCSEQYNDGEMQLDSCVADVYIEKAFFAEDFEPDSPLGHGMPYIRMLGSINKLIKEDGEFSCGAKELVFGAPIKVRVRQFMNEQQLAEMLSKGIPYCKGSEPPSIMIKNHMYIPYLIRTSCIYDDNTPGGSPLFFVDLDNGYYDSTDIYTSTFDHVVAIRTKDGRDVKLCVQGNGYVDLVAQMLEPQAHREQMLLDEKGQSYSINEAAMEILTREQEDEYHTVNNAKSNEVLDVQMAAKEVMDSLVDDNPYEYRNPNAPKSQEEWMNDLRQKMEDMLDQSADKKQRRDKESEAFIEQIRMIRAEIGDEDEKNTARTYNQEMFGSEGPATTRDEYVRRFMSKIANKVDNDDSSGEKLSVEDVYKKYLFNQDLSMNEILTGKNYTPGESELNMTPEEKAKKELERQRAVDRAYDTMRANMGLDTAGGPSIGAEVTAKAEDSVDKSAVRRNIGTKSIASAIAKATAGKKPVMPKPAVPTQVQIQQQTETPKPASTPTDGGSRYL